MEGRRKVDQTVTEKIIADKKVADQDQKGQEKVGETQAREEVPWHASLPAPSSVPARISKEDVLEMLKSRKKDFVLVDLRRIDCVGGQIRGSINLPAQSLYPTLPALYELFQTAGIRQVIWFCNSSNGRGPRAAGWFADFVKEKSSENFADKGETPMKSLVLSGGIKGWALGGEDFVQMMDGYVFANWKSIPT